MKKFNNKKMIKILKMKLTIKLMKNKLERNHRKS